MRDQEAQTSSGSVPRRMSCSDADRVKYPWPRIVISGHARLPQDAAARALYEILAVVVTVEPDSGVILDVDSTLVTRPAREYVAELLIGTSLDESPECVLECVQRFYWGGAKKALAAAIRELYDGWADAKKQLVGTTS